MQNIVFEVGGGIVLDRFDYDVGDGPVAAGKTAQNWLSFSKRSMAANACPELRAAVGKAPVAGQTVVETQVRKTG